jgi:PAS domain S-box-containing protein
MGALMRAFDWSQTPLGSVSQWPQSLRIAVRILLGTGYPMLICWGSQYTMIYNDGYRPILGKSKHPAALGSPIAQVFTEAMDFIGPRFDNVMARGEDFTVTDQLFILDRNDYIEECYFTFSYSPAPADDGSVGGVLVTALETTERVLDDRRRRTLRDLATELARAHTEQDVWVAAALTLVSEPLTVPFAALYSFQSAERAAKLVACAGVTSTAMCPALVELKNAGVWPFEDALTSSGELIIADLAKRFPNIPPTSWGVPPDKAVILPIILREHRDPAGFLIAGISPRREFDEHYRQFFRRAAEQIATAVASARAYEEERRRAEALAEIDRAKTLFFSNVSHEFRTPLTLMLGPLEELAAKGEPRLGAEEHQQIDVARRNALRLLKLVNTLLDFSRIEAGRVQAVYQPTDLGTFTSEIASAFRSAMEKAGLRFSVHCEPLGEQVYVDRDMWEKIVLNLLSNAFKFTFEGEIAVSLQVVEDSAQLSVRDTGVGIAEEEQARVFERFHRVENTRARTYEGTGIGLALVHELVKLHSGNVRVESVLGRGSIFTVKIPFGKAHLPADRISAERTLASTALSADAYVDEAERWLSRVPETPTGELTASLLPSPTPSLGPVSDDEKELIVIADDNADMRDYLAHLLHESYNVLAVADGKQAVEAARKFRPALVLADVMMPVLDGFGVLSEIRADSDLRSTPVILLSARAGEESRVEGLQAGADDYLVKPFTARELLARVSAHVKMANLRRESAEKEARLRSEAELERRRLQELLAQAPAAIGLMSGPEHRWVYVNNDYVRVTGRTSASDFIGKTVAESLPEIQAQPFIELLDTVYRTGQPYVGREVKAVLHRSHTGQPDEAYFDFVYQPVRDAGGNLEGILVHAVEVTDKVAARNAVAESAERLLLAQTAAQIGTWEWDPLRDLRRLSPELHRLFGTVADDHAHAQKWAERVDTSDWNKVERCMTEGHRSGEMDFEYRYHHPELGLRWFYCKGRRFQDESRMFGIVQDITQRKQAEEALRESEERLRAMVETTPECVKLVAADGTLLQMNSAGLEMVGADCSEMVVGRNVYDVIAPEDRERFRQFNERVCGGERGSLEFDIIGLKGVRRHMETHAAPLRNADGSLLHLAVTRDVTERKTAEKAFRESEQKLRVVTDATPVMIWMAGADKLCFYFNKSWLDFVGRTLEQEMGNGWAENLHPDDFDRCLQIYVTSFDARRPFEMEYRLRHHSGQYRWILDHGVPRYTPDGTFEGYVGGCLDIQDQKEAAEKLRIAAEELRESEERYRTVAETASDAIVSIDESSTILFTNSATAEVFGYTPEELVGKNLTMLMPDYMRQVHEAGLRRYVETGRRHLNWEATELPGLHKDGRQIPLEVSFGEYTKGGKHYFTGFARDITERKRAEEALRQSEMEFRGLANSMPTLVWMANPDGWIFWYNQRWYEYTGTTLQQMEGWGWQSVHDPEVLPTVLDQWKKSIATAEPFEMTFPLRGADGQFRPFLTRVTPVRDSHGNLTRWFGTNTDVSSQIEVQERLQAALFASQKLATIVESSNDAIVSKNLQGIVTSWNPAAERLFGYSAQEMIGQPITLTIPPELHDDERTILETIGRGTTIEHYETIRQRKSGERIYVSITVSPIRDEVGSVIGAANITRDITQQKKAEEALRTSERLAAVGRLAATVAHEINNPLAAVTNLIYLSKQNAVRDDVKEFLTSAEEELERVSHLTKQTLGFYRESKEATAIKLGDIVESTTSVFATRTRNKGITVESEIKGDPEIYAVPSELRQVVGNLLSNSIDAVESGGRIRIRVSATTSTRGVRLTVADSGPGIPDRVRARIFEPFFTTKKDVGTGLGLWICKSIVDRHGGSIKIRSKTVTGRSGTVVSIVLPLSKQGKAIIDPLKQAV